MSQLSSTLVVSLVDKVSGPASKVSSALKRAEAQTKAIARATAAGVSNRLTYDLQRIGASAHQIDHVTHAWEKYRRSAGLAADATKWTKQQIQQVKVWERANLSAIKRVNAEQARAARTGGPTGSGGGSHALSAGIGAFAAGASLPVLGVAAAGYGTKRSLDSSLSFEKAMYEVQKATDASAGGLGQYEKAVLDLARSTGKTKEELASMMASAGFAGRPKEELIAFTAYAAKATAAWGTNAEETGQAMAVLGNIYGANQTRIEEIGDALNTAADVSATREKDLLEFIKRTGATGKDAGLAAEQVLAFGAAMGEAGTPMEVAATGFEALLNVMKLGEEFSDNAGKGLKALGVSSKKMRKEFVTKPLEATLGLLEKINQVADPMKKAEILTNIFGKEYQDDIQRLMNALPRLNSLLGVMGDKTKYIGSVDSSFELATQKDFNRLERATQALDVLSLKAGNAFRVIAGGAADEINKFVDATEKGENLFQRILERIEAYDSEKNGGKGPEFGEDLKAQWNWLSENVFPNLPAVMGYNALNEWAGETRDDAARKGREAAILERVAEEDKVFKRLEELRAERAKLTSPEANVPNHMLDANERRLAVAERQAMEIRARRAAGTRFLNPAPADGLTRTGFGGFGPGGAPGMPFSMLPLHAPLPPSRPEEHASAPALQRLEGIFAGSGVAIAPASIAEIGKPSGVQDVKVINPPPAPVITTSVQVHVTSQSDPHEIGRQVAQQIGDANRRALESSFSDGVA